jgi:integrase
LCRAAFFSYNGDWQRAKLTIYQRGDSDIYWYKFMWRGKLYQESTRQKNDRVARNMEAAHRTSLAKGEVGIRDKQQIPTLADFLKNTLLPWAEATFGSTTPNSLKWYRNECNVLADYKPLAKAKLDEITGELVNQFASRRRAQGKKVATVNSSIRVLRRAMSYAVDEAGLSFIVPKLKVLPGAAERKHVVLPEEEVKYLAAAPEPLKSFATVLVDSGLRPDEAFRLRWEDALLQAGRHGALQVHHGKTAAAARIVPMTPRVRGIIEARWQAAGKPQTGWVWPAKKAKAGHMVPNSIYEPHLEAIKESKVRPFVLYSLRHTFLTRLGTSGIDPWTLARIAGHSNVAVSMKYVHPSDEKVLDALATTGSYKIGYNPKSTKKQKLLKPAKS